MKAIDTYYNGHTFRSRLEARWAVAFDHAGIKWDYEPEGFELDGVGRYLPDFWLPNNLLPEGYGAWAEVKPGPFTTAELSKARALALQSGYPVLLLSGKPDNCLYWAALPYQLKVQDKGFPLMHPLDDGSHVPLGFCISLFNKLDQGRGFFFIVNYFFPENGFAGVNVQPLKPSRQQVTNPLPVIAANSARFEFGHSGSFLPFPEAA